MRFQPILSWTKRSDARSHFMGGSGGLLAA
jgi:hypothetical protein